LRSYRYRIDSDFHGTDIFTDFLNEHAFATVQSWKQWALVYPTTSVLYTVLWINKLLDKLRQIVHGVVMGIHSTVLDR
jgi:hypothetical protein